VSIKNDFHVYVCMINIITKMNIQFDLKDIHELYDFYDCIYVEDKAYFVGYFNNPKNNASEFMVKRIVNYYGYEFTDVISTEDEIIYETNIPYELIVNH